MTPITKAAQGVTTEVPAVIPTSPPRAPFMAMVKSYDASPVAIMSMMVSVN
eukprot:CAMPEP_0194025972 /NCGR_PEP_ID=MMETSP0009_2-20130614/280_1 /TAXON_ID=210454 /ORGANISM="Grammatophora oceanica, Strain CCMP 410" /LENGTH=50 /DNA_ID=CAMNT_0038664407 /DNA_START=84 /DNA_END=233 /DNA_ORIENTATION=-